MKHSKKTVGFVTLCSSALLSGNVSAQQRGFPSKLRCDNGPELVSNALAGWAEDHGFELDVIKPGKPTQNSCVERFNLTYRDEILDLCLLRSLAKMHDLTGSWRRKYNEDRPHDALGDLSPVEYLAATKAPKYQIMRGSSYGILTSSPRYTGQVA